MATRGKRPDKSFDYAGQWDEPEDEELVLPSGKSVLLRTPNLPALAARGLIPNHILPVVEKFVLGGMPTLIKEVPQITTISAEEPGRALIRHAELNDYIDAMCVASVVAPPLSFDGKPGTIGVSRLTFDDRYAIWDWGVGLTKALATFRGEPGRTLELVGPLPDGEGVRDAAEPVDRADAAS